jgi:hypothetical protein
MMKALDDRRRQLGISQERLCAMMGAADRRWANLLNPDGKSFRVPRWNTLQVAFETLWPEGHRHLILAADDEAITDAIILVSHHFPNVGALKIAGD